MPNATLYHRQQAAINTGNIATYIGLVDDGGNEIVGGDPAYARKPVTWTAPDGDAKIHPTESPLFDVPGGDTVVAGWRSYTALTHGEDLGGKTISPSRTFAGQGTLLLDKDEMGWQVT